MLRASLGTMGKRVCTFKIVDRVGLVKLAHRDRGKEMSFS